MGVCNDIKFTCPHCGRDLYFSLDERGCDVYNENAVPVETATKVVGRSVWCQKCCCEFRIDLREQNFRTVPLKLVKE